MADFVDSDVNDDLLAGNSTIVVQVTGVSIGDQITIVGIAGESLISVTDDDGNTYSLSSEATAGFNAKMASAVATAAGTVNVTLTFNDDVAMVAFAHALTDVGELREFVVNMGTGTALTSGNFETDDDDSAIVSCLIVGSGGTITPDDTQREIFQITGDVARLQDELSNSAGTHAATGTVSSSQTWVVLTAVYGPPGGTTFEQDLSETIDAGDAARKSAGKGLGESIDASDAAVRQITRLLAEAISADEEIAKLIERQLEPEALVAADGLMRTAAKALVETASLTDAQERAFAKVIAEGISVNAGVRKLSIFVYTETLLVSEAVAKLAAAAFTETVSVADSVAVIRLVVLVLTETITIADARRNAPRKALAESVSAAEGLGKLTGLAFLQVIGISDALLKLAASTLAEDVTASDAFATSLVSLKVFAEGISAADTRGNQIRKALVEAVSTSVGIQKLVALVRLEAVSIGHALRKMMVATYSEEVTIEDGLSVTQLALLVFAESVGVAGSNLKRIDKALSAGVDVGATGVRLVGKLVTVPISAAAGIGKVITRTFTEALSVGSSILTGDGFDAFSDARLEVEVSLEAATAPSRSLDAVLLAEGTLTARIEVE